MTADTLSTPEATVKPATLVGAALIVLGVVALVFRGISFKEKDEVLDVGPVEVTAEDKETIPLSPILGVLAIVGGVVVLATSRRRV
jgi:hypothetical protein